ncbi:hypothetical protein AWM70_10440 [Paenibacillus yonginensis]|uniref:DUF4430 domain-containing protein n=1 Tax=Paenibacillus yonginensis TaxID=1462996 RepID=A0A1B1N0N4_9BACL|nr:hypothetical protein [Paenibacillus yonginensis]ANS74966.1 hypothetical protein AWM70_10440 [Paenibacillus yonginensis]
MSWTSWIGRLLLGLLACSVLLFSAACSSRPSAEPQPSVMPLDNKIRLRIDGERLIPDITRTFPVDELKKPDLREVLRSSGIIVLNDEQDGIVSVGDISLDNGLSWAVKVNGAEAEASSWGKTMHSGDEVLVYLKGKDGATASSLTPVVLNISGGLSKPSMQYYFVNIYQANLTVRSVLMQCGLIQLNDGSRLVTSVNGYTGNVNEQWVVKLNNKKLLQSGLDIPLQPSDKLEVVLSQI